ncbi:MAG: hypothetical protein JSU73_14285 [candidate division WOR-3 bacterium]|nr:MAG: hypothetical protein JSU73_14285 [candidate division WOR-3 bacterium]
MARPARTTSLLLAAFVACAAIDLTTFRTEYAHHSLLSWSARLSASGALEFDSLEDVAQRGLSSSGWVKWEARTLSDNLDWFIEAPLSASYGSGLTSVWNDTASEKSWQSGRLVLDPRLEVFGYQPGTDLFIHAGIDAGVDFRASSRSNGENYREEEYEAEGDIALGWGRVRDAWPLLKATYVERILTEEGVLSRDLTDEELLEVAAFLSRSWRLFLAHQRPHRHLYDSLATLLVRTGATRGPLPARALMRLDEDLYVGSFERRFGCRVSAGTYYHARQYFSSETNEDTSETRAFSDAEARPSTRLTVARPAGTRSVLEADLTYRPTWNQTEYNDFQHRFELVLGARYQVLDRLEVAFVPACRASYLTWKFPNYEPQQLRLDPEIGMDCAYYLAERLRITGSITWSGYLFHEWERGDRSPSAPTTDGGFAFKVRLSWGRPQHEWENHVY